MRGIIREREGRERGEMCGINREREGRERE